MLHEIQQTLSATPLAGYVSDTVWFKALLESVHIIGDALILFSVGMICARLVGLTGRSEPVGVMARRFAPWIWPSLAVVVITGVILLTGAGRRGLDNPMFSVKLITMLLAVIATAALQASLSAHPGFWENDRAGRAAAMVAAPACFLLWLATVFAGRLLAYSTVFFIPKY